MHHKIALIGFGTVGQGLVEILIQKQQESFFEKIKVVAVADLMKGSVYHPDGLDIHLLMDTLKKTGRVDTYPHKEGLIIGWDSIQTILQSNADTIIEVTYTDVKTGQPGLDHCKTAFQAGKHVITSNKGPVALAYQELKKLAEQNQVLFQFEGTVMSGTPALRLPEATLIGNEITEMKGILNGTTNYILTQMEQGFSYADALQEAQKLGYAEADPTSDVEGYDVLYKMLILSNVVMDLPLTRDQIDRQGISHLTLDDIREAQQKNKRWKLIAHLKKEEKEITASVRPVMVSLTDPLASISGALNAITYQTDLAGPITLVGAGAGRTPTGYSLLIDLIHIIRQQK